jgi:hypothetical protein
MGQKESEPLKAETSGQKEDVSEDGISRSPIHLPFLHLHPELGTPFFDPDLTEPQRQRAQI